MKPVYLNEIANIIDVPLPRDKHNKLILTDRAYLSIEDLKRKAKVKLSYIKSGSTGHVFKIWINGTYKCAMKVVPYMNICQNKQWKEADINNESKPENVELIAIYLLSELLHDKGVPHILTPITTFLMDTDIFTKYGIDGTIDIKANPLYKKFIKERRKGILHKLSSVNLIEFADRADFSMFIKSTSYNITPGHWRIFMFQIMITLATIHQKYPAFRHNDLKANNILVTKISTEEKNLTYIFNGITFSIPNIGCRLLLSDFDFVSIQGIIENDKVNADWTSEFNLTSKPNRYYDIHYFLSSLVTKNFYPSALNSDIMGDDFIAFYNRVIPHKYRHGTDAVNDNGRLLVDVEYTTPEQILLTDPYFKLCYR